MTILEVVILLLIAGACGAVAQVITGYTRGGLLVAMILGFVGAMFGLWMARSLALPEPLVVQVGDANFPILWSIIGASLFVAAIGMFTRRPYYR